MGVQARRAREREGLRQKILDAARDLFVNEGYESVSMRKIADRIEYSPTTIYLHFRDKAELLDRVCEATQLSLLETVERLTEDLSDPVEVLRQCAWAYASFGLEHPEDYKLTVVLRPQYQNGLGIEPGSVVEKLLSYLSVVVEECVKQKRFRQVDLEMTGQAMWSAVHGVVSLVVSYPDFPWDDRERLINHVIDTMIEGLVIKP